MPIGKNSISRVKNNGYTNIKNTAPDMEDSKISEKKSAPVSKNTDSKQDYEEKKRENARRRSEEKKIERAKARIEELEGEIVSLDEELFGSAASDYIRAAEIDKRKSEIEEELLSLYELVM